MKVLRYFMTAIVFHTELYVDQDGYLVKRTMNGLVIAQDVTMSESQILDEIAFSRSAGCTTCLDAYIANLLPNYTYLGVITILLVYDLCVFVAQ